MPYLNFGLGVQVGFRKQNYQRDHSSDREIHCVTTSIQKLEMTGGVQNEKKKNDREATNDETQFCRQMHARVSYGFQCSG